MIRGPQRPRAIRYLHGLFVIFRDSTDLKFLKARNVPRRMWPKPDEEKEKGFCDFYRRTP